MGWERAAVLKSKSNQILNVSGKNCYVLNTDFTDTYRFYIGIFIFVSSMIYFLFCFYQKHDNEYKLWCGYCHSSIYCGPGFRSRVIMFGRRHLATAWLCAHQESRKKAIQHVSVTTTADTEKQSTETWQLNQDKFANQAPGKKNRKPPKAMK